MSSGSREPVQSVTTRVPSAGAAAISAGEPLGAAARHGVRMGHVERARDRRHLQAARGDGRADLRPADRAAATAAGERDVELDAVEAGPGDRVERRVERGRGNVLAKMPRCITPRRAVLDGHVSPDSTERAIATRARIAARPSSTWRPSCGAPWRIVSAKPSIWRL